MYSRDTGFPSGSVVKNPPANVGLAQETLAESLSGKDPLEKEMATYSSILVQEISWTEEPGRLQSMGSRKSQTIPEMHAVIRLL